MDEETRYLIEQLDKRFTELLNAEVRRLEELRAADQLAVQVAWRGVSDRMQGFPQQYATKAEQDAIKETAIRLERDSISREVYEQRHTQLTSDVAAALPKLVFDPIVAEWTIWRRQVNTRLDEQAGSKQGMASLIGVAIGAVGLVSAVVVIVNILIH